MNIGTTGQRNVIKLLVERDRPPSFNLATDKEVARHARISLIAELAGRWSTDPRTSIMPALGQLERLSIK
jgi:hypothetical protein